MATERNSFFAGAYYEALDTGPANSKLIVGGDFNCATSVLDVQPLPGRMVASSARLVGGQHLQTVNSLFALVDTVQHLHRTLHQPTHYQGFSQTTGGSSAAAGAAGTAAAAAGTSAAADAVAARGARPPGSATSGNSGSTSGSASAALQGGRLDYIVLHEDLVEGGWLQAAEQHPRYLATTGLFKLRPPNRLQGHRRYVFPNHLLGNRQYVQDMKSTLNTTIQQWQQQHPTGSKLEMLEAVKEAASVNTQIWHDNFKQEQQQHRRDLWRAVKLAKERVQVSQHDGQLIANLLTAERRLTEYDTAAAERRKAATEPLWEVYGESSTYWFDRLGREPPESQLISSLHPPGLDQQPVPQKRIAGVAEAGDLLADFYDSAKGGSLLPPQLILQQAGYACRS